LISCQKCREIPIRTVHPHSVGLAKTAKAYYIFPWITFSMIPSCLDFFDGDIEQFTL